MKGDGGKFERCPLKVNQAMVIGGDDDDAEDDDDGGDDGDDDDMMMIILMWIVMMMTLLVKVNWGILDKGSEGGASSNLIQIFFEKTKLKIGKAIVVQNSSVADLLTHYHTFIQQPN